MRQRASYPFIIIIILASVFFTLCLNESAPAIAQTVGLQPGMWIKYNYTTSEGGQIVNEGWDRTDIQGVSGTTISGKFHTQVTLQYGVAVNNSYEWTFSINVATNPESSAIVAGYFLPANLQTGQTIPGTTVTITGNANRTYAGFSRNVEYYSGYFPDTSESGSFFWDKETGVLLEKSVTGYYGGSVQLSNEIKAIDTNLWTYSPQPTAGGGTLGMEWWMWVIVAIGIVCVAVAAFLIIRKKKPRMKGTDHPSQNSMHQTS